MSINSLANAALARRADFEPANAVPQDITEIADAAAVQPKPVDAPTPASNGNAVLQTLTTYIPTEILTLYVSALAALGPWKIKIGDEVHQVGLWAPFFICLAATPLLVWIAFATKLRQAGKPLPLSLEQWPLWEMGAASIAYFAWTYALPNSPFARYEQVGFYSSGLASFLVLVVSAGLGAVAPLMQRSLPAE